MSYDIDITKTPPAHEPERQYYYMAKAKDFVEKKSKEMDTIQIRMSFCHSFKYLPDTIQIRMSFCHSFKI